MVRIVKEHAVRRDEILDAGLRLIYTKGYERMTIQDILDDLRISKGAFYHYFASKTGLLEAVIDRLIDDTEQRLSVVVYAPDLTALEKFERFFRALGRQKTEEKLFLIALMRVWFHDDNALTREKVRVAGKRRLTPLLTAMIRQGVDEGVLTTPYPDRVAEVFLSVVDGLDDTLGRQMLDFVPERSDLDAMERTVAVYADALERITGAPSGSFQLVEPDTLKDWAESLNGARS